MIFLILGILFLAIGIPLSIPYARYYRLSDHVREEIEWPIERFEPVREMKSFLRFGCVVMLLDILGVVFILIFIIKKFTRWL